MASPSASAVHRKIMPAHALAPLLAAARQAGRTVVQCHGCFDIVHPGHVRYLQSARALGDILVVSLTSDAGVNKGLGRPYIPEELRAENLAVLEFVDWVVVDPHPTAVELLAALRPDVFVKGSEYARSSDPRFLAECAVVEGYGGRVVFHSGDVVFSSTRLVSDIARDAELDLHRLRTFCARHAIDARRVSLALERFGTARVLVAGDVIRDEYALCDVEGHAPDAPLLALRELDRRAFWSAAAGIALRIRSLGAEVTLVCAGGAAEQAQALAAALHDAALPHTVIPGGCGVLERTTFVGDDAKVARVSRGNALPLDRTALRAAATRIAALAAEHQALVWCDQGLGFVVPELLAATAAIGLPPGLQRVGSAGGARGSFLNLAGVDLLVGEERTMRDAMSDLASGLPAVVWNLLQRTQAAAAVVHVRKRGLLALHTDDRAGAPGLPDRLRSEFIESFSLRPRDTLATLEAVVALVALTRAIGESVALATYLAAAAAALTEDGPGGAPVTLAALRAWCDGRPELRGGGRFVAHPAAAAAERAAVLDAAS